MIDPKSDLCNDILARLPEERIEDVIVLNPAATDRPIGFNILQAVRDEQARELVVDDVVRIFAEVWKSSFGPRTADVLRNALLTLTATPERRTAPRLPSPRLRRCWRIRPSAASSPDRQAFLNRSGPSGRRSTRCPPASDRRPLALAEQTPGADHAYQPAAHARPVHRHRRG